MTIYHLSEYLYPLLAAIIISIQVLSPVFLISHRVTRASTCCQFLMNCFPAPAPATLSRAVNGASRYFTAHGRDPVLGSSTSDFTIKNLIN